MKLHFADQTFSFELLRSASYGMYGGSEIGEVLATAKQIQTGDFDSWHRAWHATASHIEAIAEHSLHQRHCLSAGQAFLRASNYYRAAEFFLAPEDSRRQGTFEKSRTTFGQFLELSRLCAERVHIPYEGTTLPGYLYHVEKDHFIPREQVDQLYAALQAPKTLRVFTAEEGAEEHCQFGNITLLHQVLFDWLDDTL